MTTEPEDTVPDDTERYAVDDHLGERTVLVAAAYVVLQREREVCREVLLHQRQNTGYRDGYWALIAGHVDPGESVHEGARREAGEEAGVRIAAADLVPLTAMHRFERGGAALEQRADYFFTATRWTGEPHIVEPDKAAAMGWFGLADLPDPVVPHERHVIDLVLRGQTIPAVISWEL
jgi:8-oxo-dGTP diphosphatase